MEKLVVNKDASAERIQTEYKYALKHAKEQAEQGFSDFTLEIMGSYSECHEVLRKLEANGIFCHNRGFSHSGNGSTAGAEVKVFIKQSK